MYFSVSQKHFISISDGEIVLQSHPGRAYPHCRVYVAYTYRILGLVSIHNPTMPLHIACMFHLQHLHSKLFILAHEMVDREPENAISWYAVGVWYLSCGKWPQARQYFRYRFFSFVF